jgi:hypothetical protein
MSKLRTEISSIKLKGKHFCSFHFRKNRFYRNKYSKEKKNPLRNYLLCIRIPSDVDKSLYVISKMKLHSNLR